MPTRDSTATSTHLEVGLGTDNFDIGLLTELPELNGVNAGRGEPYVKIRQAGVDDVGMCADLGVVRQQNPPRSSP